MFGFVVEKIGIEDMAGSAADVFFVYERIFLILPAIGNFLKVPFVHHFVPFGYGCQEQSGYYNGVYFRYETY